MKKIKILFYLLIFCFFPALCPAQELDAIKADFLRGNYRRVIFEGKSQASSLNAIGADELNYILGLSFLKEERFEEARESFSRIQSNKFKEQAKLGIADTFLIEGRLQEAENFYNKLNGESGNKLKPSLLYRLSELELRKGNPQKANSYLSELRKNFPLSPELKVSRGIPVKAYAQNAPPSCAKYSVQVGFFSNSANAQKLKAKLLACDFSAYVEKSTGGFRVKVGILETLRDAQDMLTRLLKEGYPGKICSQ